MSEKELVIAAIIKSQKQQNVILITTGKYSAEFLIQHEKIWKNYFEYAGVLKDKAWFKVVIHEIFIKIFNFSQSIQLLKNEIEIFNEIHSVAINWLSSSQNRDIKKHCSAVVAFESHEEAQKALNHKLLIAGVAVRTARFEEKKDSEQCSKC